MSDDASLKRIYVNIAKNIKKVSSIDSSHHGLHLNGENDMLP